MYRLLIADDEPRIRRGIRSLEWETLNVEVVAEASNGVEALELVENHAPDIMLVDINMPYLNGLQLIEQVKKVRPQCVMIIVSGYDEFEYAKEAVKLNVFDYILKPVNRKELMNTVVRAIEVIQKNTHEERFVRWAETQVANETVNLKRQFVKNWFNHKLTKKEIQENLDVFQIKELENKCLIVLKKLEVEVHDAPKLEDELLDFCILNIFEELIEPFSMMLSFSTMHQYYGAIINHQPEAELFNLQEKIQLLVSKYLMKEILIEYQVIGEDIFEIPSLFVKLKSQLDQRSELSSIVLLAKVYIEKNFTSSELNILEVAEHIGVSSSYLSRLLKKETGLSFTNFVSKLRIDKAVELMNDPTLKIFEVAEMTGFGTQHYFSAAFKKVRGVSPNVYRNRKDEEE